MYFKSNGKSFGPLLLIYQLRKQFASLFIKFLGILTGLCGSVVVREKD